MRTLPEAPVILERRLANDETETVRDHPMLSLLDSPNPYYDGHLLTMALAGDLALSGNAYVLKVRSNGGAPVELWWAPSSMMEPRWPSDGSAYLSHYDYTPAGQTIRIQPEDVVHVRDGLDPQNTRKGLSALASLLREVFTDNEAANMTASLLANMGVPGLVISPEGNVMPSPTDVTAIKEFFQQQFTGDKRGAPLVIGAPTKVQQFGFSPEQMNVKALRRIPEERVTAVMGIPAIVAGLGAGLDRSTFANFAEAREMAYESAIIPMLKLFDAVWRRQLLVDFERDIGAWRVLHDLSEVRVLQEDQNKLAQRLTQELQAGAITVGEYRQELGFPVDASHDIYLRPFTAIEVPIGQPPRVEAQPDMDEETRALEGGDTKAFRLTARQRRFMATMHRQSLQLEAGFSSTMRGVFRALGKEAASVYSEITSLVTASANGHEEKAQPDDESLVRQVMTRIGIDQYTQDKVAPAYAGHYQLTAETVFATVNEVLGLEAFLSDPIARRILEAGGKRVGLLDLGEKTKDAMFRALADGRDAGESSRELSKRVQEYVTRGPWSTVKQRGDVIARTETNYAVGMSTLDAYESSPVVRGIMLIDAQLGPTDAECLPAGTEIVALDAERGFARWFEGNLIDIVTRNGKHLSATANHPILTPSGWVCAGELHEGNEIICGLWGERVKVLAARQCRPYDDDMPATGKQGFDFPQVPSARIGISESVTTSHLNGNGRESQVDVVLAESALRGGNLATLFEQQPERFFVGAAENALGLTGECASGEVVHVAFHAPGCGMGGTDVGHALGGRQAAIHQGAGLGIRTQSVAVLVQAVEDTTLCDAQLDSDLSGGQAAFVQHNSLLDIGEYLGIVPCGSTRDAKSLQPSANSRLADAEGGRQLIRALAGEIVCDQIIKVNIVPFAGHVYNLQTRQGWYLANGIVTHNCEARNGRVVSVQEAREARETEHVNGTLAALPIT